MRLKILLPERILMNEEVQKVSAEGEDGSFTLLPKHVDFASSLVPGLVSFVDKDGHEGFLAAEQGILVKCGSEVMISTRVAVLGDELGTLEQIIDERFKVIDERERKTRSALAKMEADLSRRFFEWSSGRYE